MHHDDWLEGMVAGSLEEEEEEEEKEDV